MNTQTLISQLAAQASATPSPHLRTRIVQMLVLPSLLSLVLLVGLWGINPDLQRFAHTTAFWIKELWLAALILSVWPLVLRLARPGVSAGRYPQRLLATWGGMAALGFWQLSSADTRDVGSAWLGTSWQVCSVSIVALALPLLGGLLWVLRDMAPTRPAWCGAVAGLLAGGMAALIYSLHCPESAFAFLSIWYAAGMVGVGALGAALGAKLLHW